MIILLLILMALPPISFAETKTSLIQQKIIHSSQSFLGRPYSFDPLKDDQFAGQLNSETFDCLTFIQSILAIAHSNDQSIKDNFIKARYLKSPYTYFNRIHFVPIEMNPHYQKLGWIKPLNLPLQKQARTIIKLKNFWAQKVKQKSLTPPDHFIRSKSPAILSSIHYIGKNELIKNNTITNSIAKHLPAVMMVEFVHQGWHPKNLKTPLQVSHLGLLIQKNSKWILRHASIKKGIVDEDFIAYIKNKSSPSFIGVSLWELT